MCAWFVVGGRGAGLRTVFGRAGPRPHRWPCLYELAHLHTTDYGDAVEWARDRFSMPLEVPVLVDPSEVGDGGNSRLDNHGIDAPEPPVVIGRKRGRGR